MAAGKLHAHADECGEENGEIRDGGILGRDGRAASPVRALATAEPLYALLTNGLPGETKPTRCSLAVRRSLSLEAEAAARRLRNFAIFSARVRRRRISGRRLGADIKFSLVFSDDVQ